MNDQVRVALEDAIIRALEDGASKSEVMEEVQYQLDNYES